MIQTIFDTDCLRFVDGDRTVLTMQEEEIEGGFILKLSGELRSDVAHDVYDEMVALITVGMDIIVDFEGVTYITATTQDIFRRVQIKSDELGKGSLTLCHLPRKILAEFESTGASELLMIED